MDVSRNISHLFTTPSPSPPWPQHCFNEERMAKVVFSKLTRSRRERIKRREGRFTDRKSGTVSMLKQPTVSLNNMVSLFKSGSLKSLVSLDGISSSSSVYSSRYLNSLVASLSWKSLAPSANEAGGRDQPIQVVDTVSAPGSPVKQRLPAASCETSDTDALSTLSEFRVLHYKVMQGLTKRTNALMRRQARRRKSTCKKAMTPSTSATSLNFSVGAKSEEASSTPLSKVGNRSNATDLDTTLVNAETPAKVEQEGAKELVQKENISIMPDESPKESLDSTGFLTPQGESYSEGNSYDGLGKKLQPKDKVATNLSEKPFLSACQVGGEPDAQTASSPSPTPVQLPPSLGKEATQRVPLSLPESHLNSLASQPPTQSDSHAASKPLDDKENIPPPGPPNASTRVNARPLSKSKKPARYRDKLPRSVLAECTPQSYFDAVQDIIDRAREVNKLTPEDYVYREKSSGLELTLDKPHRHPHAVDDYYPPAPGGWEGDRGSSAETPGTRVPQKTRTDVNLEHQMTFQNEGIDEPSLFSTLNSVSYIVDLVVFPLKFVWRMTYGN